MAEMQKAETRDLDTRQQSHLAAANGSRQERRAVPPVEIFEKDDALMILADMPGVTPDTLNVEVGNRTLIIEGSIGLDMPEGVSATFAEVQNSGYHRRFTIGEGIDTAGIEGSIKNGVLTVRLPKQEPLRKRRIEVQAA